MPATHVPSDVQTRHVSNDQLNDTINLLRSLVHGDQERLSSNVEELHSVVESLKQAPEGVWESVQSQGTDLVVQMAGAQQHALDVNVAQAADEVGILVYWS